MPTPLRPVASILGAIAVAATGFALLATIQIITGWPFGGRLTGPALYGLSIGAAVVLAFLAGRRSPDAPVLPLVMAVAAGAGLWIGARNGLLVLTAGYLVSILAGPVTLHERAFAVAMAACLAAAALLGPL